MMTRMTDDDEDQQGLELHQRLEPHVCFFFVYIYILLTDTLQMVGALVILVLYKKYKMKINIYI